ncbi:MAG: hypothetical protein JO112_05240 [Planctomycetes bacterium]|nr:hypothetical protein [Planctomycetota bacterium]
MLDSHRVIAVTLAGRRPYLEILAAYSLRDRGVIDEHHLWVNTAQPQDVAYLHGLAGRFPDYFRIVPARVPPGPGAYAHFYRPCQEPGTLYLKLDDDICFIERGAVAGLLDFRLRHPDYFLVSGNVVNTFMTSHVYQTRGLLDHRRGTAAWDPFSPVSWAGGGFAEYVHRTFLAACEDGLEAWRFPTVEVRQRLSINVVCWRGEDFAAFDGVVGGDDEPWLSEVKPRELGRCCALQGGGLFAHFAYFTQRAHLEGTDLLSRYRALCVRECPELPVLEGEP